ncbi:hypothetical protein C8D92_103243 [Tamilnaduibacter salinus]|uniref:Uncharacterized protein n=1 Tax=Tamilnaduibacter salinus TaxID=1484056 RepID=A0A2U1CYJ2_9GAMM|nr:hypothetical protein [Tamilnaduibacter salinus]PVY77556.1 hypothetical protein C8D92_103243 [Tamilnaduibacter salinus]
MPLASVAVCAAIVIAGTPVSSLAQATPQVTLPALYYTQSSGSQALDVVRTKPLRYGMRPSDSPPATVRTQPLRYGLRSTADKPDVVSLPVLRFGARSGKAPTVRTPALRFGSGGGAKPVVRTPALRFGRSRGAVATVSTGALRFGVPQSGPPTVRVPALRFGAEGGPRAIATLPALRFGVEATPDEVVTLPALRYGVTPGRTEPRSVEFRLVRVTPLDPNNAINPFDDRDVIDAIDKATTPEDKPVAPAPTPSPNPQPEPEPEPAALAFTNVPTGGVFTASLNFVPSADPQQWSVAEGPDDTVRSDAAFGFDGQFVTGGFELTFEPGMGWSSPGLPTTLVLASEGPGFETRTVSFDLTRLSDGRRFRVTADVSAGSDGDISVSSASGWDCFTNTGSCP